MSEPRMIRNQVKTIDIDQLEGDLDDVIDFLKRLRTDYLHQQITLSFQSENEGEEIYCTLHETHPETIEEMHVRRVYELKQKQESEQYEREEYLKLKAKFEGKQ